MASFKAIKLQSGRYGVSNKVNTYLPDHGIYDTRAEALFKAEECNVSYYASKSQEAWESMLKLAEKAGHSTNQWNDKIKYGGEDYYIEKCDLLA